MPSLGRTQIDSLFLLTKYNSDSRSSRLDYLFIKVFNKTMFTGKYTSNMPGMMMSIPPRGLFAVLL